MVKHITLREYIFRKNMKICAFADSIGYSRTYVNEIALGSKHAGKGLAKAIELATKGQVSAKSLLKSSKKTSVKRKSKPKDTGI